MHLILLFLLFLSYTHACTLIQSFSCDITSSDERADILNITDHSTDSCATACIQSEIIGCCHYESVSNVCTIYSNGVFVSGTTDDYAELCLTNSPTVLPSYPPTLCSDQDDIVEDSSPFWGHPYITTCDQLSFYVADEVGLYSGFCDAPISFMNGATLRDYCCSTCALLDSQYAETENYVINDGACIASEVNESPAYVWDRWIPLADCALHCSATPSCSGFTLMPESQSKCRVHIHTAYHDAFVAEGWTSVKKHDNMHVDSSNNNPWDGFCAFRITEQPSQSPSFIPSSSPSYKPSVLPTYSPSFIPTVSPSFNPSVIPTFHPSTSPSTSPSHSPSVNPSTSPSFKPSVIPSTRPSVQPTVQPTDKPSVNPTVDPTHRPSVNPSYGPSSSPTVIPTNDPSVNPTVEPTDNPSVVPSHRPSFSPTVQPSDRPSVAPTDRPSVLPSVDPSFAPTAPPSNDPSVHPTDNPTDRPSVVPSYGPSVTPTCNPSDRPTVIPSFEPSFSPTVIPSHHPSTLPTVSPSFSPTVIPSPAPSHTPTVEPTTPPSTRNPTFTPTVQPSYDPSRPPTINPTGPPSLYPTHFPSTSPTIEPSDFPTVVPTDFPSYIPSADPSYSPSLIPTVAPSHGPTTIPSHFPSTVPTVKPSVSPSFAPSSSPSFDPSVDPTKSPSVIPSFNPSVSPSFSPSNVPSFSPSFRPSVEPTEDPTFGPSVLPTDYPTYLPTIAPSDYPTVSPSYLPSVDPTVAPSHSPSIQPSVQPSWKPSGFPTEANSCSQSDMNILGSDFIALQGGASSFDNDVLVLAIGFPDRYQPISAAFSGAMDDGASFSGTYGGLWDTYMSTDEGMECLRILRGQFAWGDILSNEYMGLDVHNEGNDELYFMNTLTLHFKENVTSYNFELEIIRDVYIDIPWLLGIVKQFEIGVSFNISIPTPGPSASPSTHPSFGPSQCPSVNPTVSPSFIPSVVPTMNPSVNPSNLPSVAPSVDPTVQPTDAPSVKPTVNPSARPSVNPTVSPSYRPTTRPTVLPSQMPTVMPSGKPTVKPTFAPSFDPTVCPSADPSWNPTVNPSVIPSVGPTVPPSYGPSVKPTVKPSVTPTVSPSYRPTVDPTVSPSVSPSFRPSVSPTVSPTVDPSVRPSVRPSVSPTVTPTVRPSVSPTVDPTSFPSKAPTPREEINVDIVLEVWETFVLSNYIPSEDHVDDILDVLETTDVGDMTFNLSVVQNGDNFLNTELDGVGYSPNTDITQNTTTGFIIQGAYKRYIFSILLILPSPCIGEWSAYSACSVTCDLGTQTRTFSVLVEADLFGQACEAEDEDTHTISCQVQECPNLDKIVTEFAVAEPDLNGETTLKMNFTTYVQWPWKVIEQNSTCWKITDDTTGAIVSTSDEWSILSQCEPDYIYGVHAGACVGPSNASVLVPSIWIRGIDLENPLCLEICNILETCESFDVFPDNDPEKHVCQVNGEFITSTEQNWIVDNYNGIDAYFFFRFDVYGEVKEGPVGGDGEPGGTCYIRNTPVYEGDCIQTWHVEFDVEAVCDVSGTYTVTSCTENQETLDIDVSDILMDISLDTSCATILGTINLVGDITTFADDEYSFPSSIYHVEDVVYARSTVVSYVSIVNLTLIGLIAEQSGNTYNLYDDITSQTVESLSVDQGEGEYETTMAFQFILSDIIGSGDGTPTNLYATFEASYVDDSGTVRRQLVEASGDAPVGAQITLLLFPAPCTFPSAPYKTYLSETCDDKLRVSQCLEDGWVIVLDEYEGDCQDDSNGIYLSDNVPEGVDLTQIDHTSTNVTQETTNENEELWLTLFFLVAVALLVGAAVYLYMECYSSIEDKTVLLVEDAPQGTRRQQRYSEQNENYLEKRIPNARLYTSEDDSSISITSELNSSGLETDTDALHSVFGEIFDSEATEL